MCIYPVGWTWTEYELQVRETPALWEKRAKKVCSVGKLLDEPPEELGKAAFRNGVKFRKAHIERLLMRMIKRREIIVTIYDHRMQGYEIADQMRLHAALKLDVARGIIGFNELINEDAWDCRVDAKSLLESLANQKYWELQSGKYDWLKIERYGRLLFEVRGNPSSMGHYADLISTWYGNQFEAEQLEPAYSSVQEMISSLHKEYSN